MENFHPPHLNQNTNTNEAHNQLNLWLQEMLGKCVAEKNSQEAKNHKTFGSIIPYLNSEK